MALVWTTVPILVPPQVIALTVRAVERPIPTMPIVAEALTVKLKEKLPVAIFWLLLLS